MKKLKLYPFQIKAYNSFMRKIKRKRRAQLLMAGVGTGKVNYGL